MQPSGTGAVFERQRSRDDRPAGPADHSRGRARTTAGAMISFTAPPANGSPIIGYTFTAYVGSAVYSEGSLSNATRQTVDVPNGKAFRFTIGAVNNAGAGPPSALSDPIDLGRPRCRDRAGGEPGPRQRDVRWTAAPSNGAPIAST